MKARNTAPSFFKNLSKYWARLGNYYLVNPVLLQMCAQHSQGSHYNAISVSVPAGVLLAWDSASPTSSRWCSCWWFLNHTLSKKNLIIFPTLSYRWENRMRVFAGSHRHAMAAWGLEPSSFKSQSRAPPLYCTDSRKGPSLRETCWCWWGLENMEPLGFTLVFFDGTFK